VRAFARALRSAHLAASIGLALAAIETAGAQEPAGTITGVVVDSASRRLRGATIYIAGTGARQVSDANGVFTFERLRPGRYRLTATMIGASPVADSFLVRSADTTRARFTLHEVPFKPDTLPPKIARGTRPDTVPEEAETLDLIARVGRLPVLRAHPPEDGQRELRFWIGGGIAIPYTLVRLIIDGARVDGEVVRYLTQTIPDADADARWRAFMDSVPIWLQSTFACGDVMTDTLHFPQAQRGYQNELVAVCVSRYRHDPGWRGLLRELEAHQVWTLPDASELPSIGNIVSVDGGGVTVEAWNGRRYRSYGYGATDWIPAPEAKDAGEIHRVLNAFLRRNHEIAGPARR